MTPAWGAIGTTEAHPTSVLKRGLALHSKARAERASLLGLACRRAAFWGLLKFAVDGLASEVTERLSGGVLSSGGLAARVFWKASRLAGV